MKRFTPPHLVKQNILKGITLPFILICLTSIKGFTQIQGGVFDQKKSGISNVLVIASDTSGKVIDSVRSDKRGYYMFSGLASGKYRIEASAKGFLTSVHENIIANKDYPIEVNTRNDISNATRLEIFLKPKGLVK